jgi:peptidoglycan/LPS O-acetylase OafA/YrhL
LGAILAILVNDPRATQWFRWATLPGFAIFLIDILGPLKSCGVWLDDTSINIFFAGLMACCLQRGFAQAVFEQRWLCWVGRRSYCAYVIHQPFLLVCLLIPWLRGQSLLWLLVLPFLCLPLTEVSWRYWEMPFLRLKRYFEPTA